MTPILGLQAISQLECPIPDVSWILGSLLTVQAIKLAAARERP